ncbi:MAG: glutaminase A [Hyphomonadaceae bacterium]|nr:glutaminase A [Hyphomonadaceae bacterium]
MTGERVATADGPIALYLEKLHARIASVRDGAVATYIPKLAEADPERFAIAIATTDGEVYCVGDTAHPFTIQSVSKPFMYGLALETHGRAEMLRHVGVEPTGGAFNAAIFDEDNNRPYNPMVNAGAIGVSAMTPGRTYAARRKAMAACFSRYVGRPVAIDEEVFRSERETGERNRAIAALMTRAAMIGGNTEAILDLYFSQCSVLVTCRDLALMAATLANGGVQPVTGEPALAREYVHDVLSVMNSCGMYNYAGQWSYEVGIPAKSGVSGSIIAIVPGQMGIAAFSPRLDSFGNSVRAIAACKAIAEDFGLHVFRTPTLGTAGVRSVRRGDSLRSKRRRNAHERAVLDRRGADIVVAEAQGALFFASAERLVRRLRAACADARFLILDLRRVFAADTAAARLIAGLDADLDAAGKLLFIIHGDARRFSGPFSAMLLENDRAGVFAERDEALEWCEDKLIAGDAPAPRAQPTFSLARLDLFAGLSAEDIHLVESVARPFSFEAGQHILREGEPGRLLFVIARGRASVRLNMTVDGVTRSVRVAVVEPGAAVGEMALLDGGPRSADVVADERVVCYGFGVEELRAGLAARPHILPVILANLARDLAERLRGANAHIRALEH